jgi:signal transduction histidine kinase
LAETDSVALTASDRRPRKSYVVLPKPSKHVAVALSLVLLLGAAYVEWSTGPRVSFSVVYLLPIIMGTWYGGFWFGLGMTVLATGCRLAIHTTGPIYATLPGVGGLNELVGLIGFLIVVVLLTKVKTMSEHLDRKVEERTAALQAEVSERARAEASLRTLAAQLSDAEEAERARMAADIHDSIGQSLSVLKLNLGVLARKLGGADKPPGDLLESLSLIDDIVKQVRTFTFRMHPAMLEDLGLIPTLHWYAEQFEAHAGTQVTVSESGERQPLPAALATYMFRAIKELVNNAAKHGKAKEIVIAVHWRSDSLRVVIDDDGTGFDPAQALAPQHRRGLGLAGIRERLLTLNGQLAVESKPGEGTRVIVEIALAQTHQAQVHS